MRKTPSSRQQKVASLIQTTLVECLRRGKSLDMALLGCPLTVTKVKVSAGLKISSVYVVPFNSSPPKETLLEALDKSRYALRQYVTKEIQLKYSPEIRFFYDYGFENALAVSDIMKSL